MPNHQNNFELRGFAQPETQNPKSLALLFTYLFLALSISFLCSVAEAVLLSVSLSFVKTREDRGSKSAKLLKRLKEDIDRPLSSILSLNTIAHTVGAAGVGAQATAIWGEAYFGLVSAILTLLILLLSEILPKSVGTRYWRSLALPVATIVNVMICITLPVVWGSKGITRLVSGNKPPEKVSREEIAALTDIGLEEGVFAESESKTIKNLIRSRSIKANEVMTPRTVVVSIPENTRLSGFFDDPEVRRHSRFPIYSKNPDNITGYVLKYDIIDHLGKGNGDMLIRDIRRPVVICYENTTIPKLFDILLEKKEQIAVLVDEYGGMSGIVTLEDIIETIFGLEIIDERDTQADMQQLAKDKWRERAENLHIDLTEQKKEYGD
ncbi:MAG: CNNM domain-containing protein [Bacteroidales bacterium]|nr:CNNM domain-containing protein [Bacteroidales bacterium]